MELVIVAGRGNGVACVNVRKKEMASKGSLNMRGGERGLDDEGYETSQSGFWRSLPLHRLSRKADVTLPMREKTRSGSLKKRGIAREEADDVQGSSQLGF